MFQFYLTAFTVIALMLSPLIAFWFIEQDRKQWEREIKEMFGDWEPEDKNMPTETEKRS